MILQLAGLPRWDGMTGRSLLDEKPPEPVSAAAATGAARQGS
jgi:hypothetical protein